VFEFGFYSLPLWLSLLLFLLLTLLSLLLTALVASLKLLQYFVPELPSCDAGESGCVQTSRTLSVCIALSLLASVLVPLLFLLVYFLDVGGGCALTPEEKEGGWNVTPHGGGGVSLGLSFWGTFAVPPLCLVALLFAYVFHRSALPRGSDRVIQLRELSQWTHSDSLLF